MIPSILIAPKERVSRPLWLYVLYLSHLILPMILQNRIYHLHLRTEDRSVGVPCPRSYNLSEQCPKRRDVIGALHMGVLKQSKSLLGETLKEYASTRKGLQEAWLVIQCLVPS